jgi:hypothetical protein
MKKPLPHQVRITKRQHPYAAKWCEQHLGAIQSFMYNESGLWCCSWAGLASPWGGGDYIYYFANEHDATMFAMRWL